MKRKIGLGLALGLGLVACGGGGEDGADARARADAPGIVDAGARDDAAAADAPPAAAGFGVITGCPRLDPELTLPTPSSFTSHIAFEHEFDPEVDVGALTPGGQEILSDGNAGGSSLESEIFAYELFARCDGATLLKTETEITYDGPGKITDLLVEQDGIKLGVSVTRAVAFPFDDPYTEAQAAELLERKLGDILLSSGHVSAADRWTKQALSVLAYAPGHADALAAAYATLSDEVRADTILWVIVTDGTDAFVY